MSRRLSVQDIESIENTSAMAWLVGPADACATEADSVTCHAIRTTTNAVTGAATRTV